MNRIQSVSATRAAPLTLALALIAGLPLAASQALMSPAALDSVRQQHRHVLSNVIAGQGNIALQAIRDESRAAIGHWALPALPAPAPADDQTLATR